MSSHQRRCTVEEMLQFITTAWNQVPLVAAVKYVLYFWSPPDHNRLISHLMHTLDAMLKYSSNNYVTDNYYT